MFKKLIYLVVLLMLTAGTTVQAEVFSDDFERARDYLTVGVTRSGWDGFLGLNPHETVDKLDASINRPRQLYIESTGGYYQEPFDPLGPFLYKNVEGDFIAVVRVTEFAGTLDEPLYHNAAGIMARALPDEGGPGEDEDWVSIAYFPTWTAFIAWNADDGVRTEFGQTTGTWLGDDTFAIAEQYPYLQLERVGNDFYFRISSDGVNFIPLTDPAYQGIYDGTQTPLVISRPDLDGLTLQVGLYQCTFSTDTGYVAFDDFSVEGPMVLSASKAYGPNPANEAKDVPRDVDLTWIPGMSADKHNVYFGTIFDDVNQANEANPQGVLVGQNQDGTTYDPGLLEFNKTYYWRVDEVNNLNPSSPWKGNVWSFTVANFTIVDDFEGYNNADNIIFNIWIDCVTNNTGMTVGHLSGDVAETYIVHNGKQSMYMYYDNDGSINEGQGLPLEKTGTLLYSEAERQWTDPQDWTVNGATSLTIWFRGLPPTYGSFTAGPPTYTMTARGSDIWLTSDQFHYAYKVLSGNGSITARLASITNTHQWAKAGVMIRETLNADAKHTMVVVQPGAGVAFQRRPNTGAASDEIAAQSSALAPQWVRLTRTGNIFTAEYSANGTAWTTLGTTEMPLFADAYVGLCLCSHNVNATCTAEFSNVSNPGAGDWKSQNIGIQSNKAEQLYVVLQDSAGISSPAVKNADPAATTIATWTSWNIPLTSFTGQATAGSAQTSVNLKAVKKIIIGVGDRANTQPGGSGDLYIDDIGLKLP